MFSPLRLRTYGYPCKMCSASVFVVKFKISTRKRCNARINVVHISNMMGNDGIARSWKSDWEPNSGIVVSIASDDNSPLLNTYCNITIRYSPRCLIVIAFKFGFAYCISDRAITAAWCFPRDNRAMPALFSKGEHKRMLLYCACTFAISPLLYANSKPTGVYSSAAKLPIICCI